MKLGTTAKDTITGFLGTITGHCRYITGCDQYLLQPKVNKTGDYVDGKWFDENRLVLLDCEIVTIDNSVKKGACDPAPIK